MFPITSRIRTTLFLLVSGVAAAALLVSFVALYFIEASNLRTSALDEISTLGNMIASNATATVAFGDKKSATELLEVLKWNSDVDGAKIFDSQGNEFATYGNSTNPNVSDLKALGPNATRSASLNKSGISFLRPIVLDGENIGSLFISANLNTVHKRLIEFLFAILGVGFIAALVASLLSVRLERIISAPLVDLAKLLRQVGQSKDYSLRAIGDRKDEIGDLINGFNQMLREIEIRDQNLLESQLQLEDRVTARTQELSLEVKERRKAELSANYEREQLRTVISIAPVAMAMFDREMRYLAHSGKWREDFELGERAILGECHFDLIFDNHGEWKRLCDSALSGTPEISPEHRVNLPSGGHHVMRWTAQPWGRAKGDVAGIIVVAIVIDELVKAREDAIRTARIRSEFMANISHELRTPLNGILGFTELLLEFEHRTSEDRSYLESIRTSGELLLSLINDILDLTKLETKPNQLELIGFNLSELATKTIQILSATSSRKGVGLELTFSKDIPNFVLGDPTRIQQVLMNLIGNAIKFTDKGNVTLAIEVDNAIDDPKPFIKFTVTDTGIGVPEDKVDVIFEAFSQADGSITRRFGGTGLGLAIVKKLVTLMGGTIKVASRVGAGSQFSFSVPLPDYQRVLSGNATTVSKSNANDLDEPSQFIEKDKPKILVAEDNQLNQRLLQAILMQAGYEVIMANNGMEAIELHKNYRFRAILMDVQMPVMDGCEATTKIRELERKSSDRVPIIALTAHAFSENRDLCISAGMNGYLTKPIDREALLELIAHLHNQRNSKAYYET